MRARAFAAADGILDDLRQLQSARDRLGGARLDDGAGDAAAVVVLAIIIDQIGERGFAEPVDGVGGGEAFFLHAHVEIGIRLKREAARGFVELKRGNPEIEHGAP